MKQLERCKFSVTSVYEYEYELNISGITWADIRIFENHGVLNFMMSGFFKHLLEKAFNSVV